jgi:integral membrane protein (TIGR03766 family)
MLMISLIPVCLAVGLLEKKKQSVHQFITRISKYKKQLYVVMVAYQLVILLFCSALASADTTAIFHAVIGGRQEYPGYFNYFPNNAPVYFVFFLLVEAFGEANAVFVFQIINILIIDLCIVWVYKITQKYIGDEESEIVFLLFVFLFGMTPQFLYTYSDILTIPGTSLLVHILLLACNRKKLEGRFSPLLLGLSGGFAVFYLKIIKTSSLIIIMAVIIMTVLLFNGTKIYFRKYIQCYLMALVTAGLLSITYSSFLENQKLVQVDESQSFPLTHWLMIGSDSTRGPTEELIEITKSQPTKREKVKKNIQHVVESVNSRGMKGEVHFLFQKYKNNVDDGGFGWKVENVFSSKSVTTGVNRKLTHSVFGEQLQDFIFSGSDKNNVLMLLAQIVYVIVVFGLFIYGLTSLRCTTGFFDMTLKTSIIGLMVFLLLFEGGRTRYLIQFLPLILILSAKGIAALDRGVISRRKV